MVKMYWKSIVALPLAFASTAAFASSQGPSRISYVHVMDNGIVMFIMTGTRSTPPSCGTPTPTRWAFNGATAAGQAKLSVLLTAYASGKNIMIYGTGACADYYETESVAWFHTID